MSDDKEPSSTSDDSFRRAEKVFEEEEEERRRCSPQSPPFDMEDSWDNNRDSFVTALENPGDLSSPPPDNVGGGMSTIEEESKSYETSTTGASTSRRMEEGQGESDRDLDESQELREMQKLVDDTSAELNQNQRPTTTESAPNPGIPAGSPNEEDVGLQELLLKLAKLESAQNVLENVLNEGIPEDMDIDALIAQLPLDPSLVFGSSNKGGNNGEDDQSQRSFSSEIASIQKIIDGADLSMSMHSEVAGGNNIGLVSSSEVRNHPRGINSEDRPVEDVLKEYDDLERSMSSASAIYDDSFRSDMSSVPLSTSNSNQAVEKVLPATNPPPPPVAAPANSSPVIKPPVLKTVVPPPTTTSSAVTAVTNPTQMSSNSNLPREYYYYSAPKESNQQGRETTDSSSRTRPMTSNPTIKNVPGSRSSRIESSQSAHGIKSQHSPVAQSARTAASATTTSSKDKNTQDSYKPRNRRMLSPRTNASPRQPHDKFAAPDIPTHSSAKGGGEGSTEVSKKHKTHSHQKGGHTLENVEAVVATEALKTIEKLNTMVTRQETLLGAYSKDNEKLWEQLREAKNESQEKEAKFQDVISSLKTEVATLKVNRLATHNNAGNKGEVQKSREEAELKSQQLMELRKEVLQLQSKLAARQAGIQPRANPSSSAQHVSLREKEEKEREHQKTIATLNKQVRTLQRILYSKEETAPPPPPASSETNRTKQPMQRTKSDVGRRHTSNNASKHSQQHRSSMRNPPVDVDTMAGRSLGASNRPVNINTGEVLQASLNCLEQERDEFENIIEDKNKLLYEKEKTILKMKEEIETLKNKIPDPEDVEPFLINELRSRIIAQNKVIKSMKEHLSTFKKLEAENMQLRDEKCTLEQQARELRKRLEFAQSLVKPENEVLCLLSEKVDELNSRYYQRERQLDSLLNRLTVKTTTGGGGAMSSSSSNDSTDGAGGCLLHSSNLSPRRRLPLGQFNNNNGSLGGALLKSSIGGKGRSSALISTDILHMVDISPSNSFQLFDTITDPDFPDA